MPELAEGSSRRLGLLFLGLLVALGLGVVVGYLTFSGSGDEDSDQALACVSLAQLPEEESFAELTDDGIVPALFRLQAVGAHAAAVGEDEPEFHDAGVRLFEAANRLDEEKGDEALDELRDLCA